MSDIQDTDDVQIPDNWDSGEVKKPSRIARFINIKDMNKSLENDKAKSTRGRKPAAYKLTKPVAEMVAKRLFQTVGLATRCLDIWTLTDDEAKTLGDSAVPVFNALPEKVRTFTGEQGSRAGLVLALFQFGKVVKDVTMPRVIATKLSQLESATDYETLSDEEIGGLFANLRTGTNG
jgi:hypothetical protein